MPTVSLLPGLHSHPVHEVQDPFFVKVLTPFEGVPRGMDNQADVSCTYGER